MTESYILERNIPGLHDKKTVVEREGGDGSDGDRESIKYHTILVRFDD